MRPFRGPHADDSASPWRRASEADQLVLQVVRADATGERTQAALQLGPVDVRDSHALLDGVRT